MANREIMSRYRQAYSGIVVADMVNRGELPTPLLPNNAVMARDIAESRKIPKVETEVKED